VSRGEAKSSLSQRRKDAKEIQNLTSLSRVKERKGGALRNGSAGLLACTQREHHAKGNEYLILNFLCVFAPLRGKGFRPRMVSSVSRRSQKRSLAKRKDAKEIQNLTSLSRVKEGKGGALRSSSAGLVACTGRELHAKGNEYLIFEFPLRSLRLCERKVFSFAPRHRWPNGATIFLSQRRKDAKEIQNLNFPGSPEWPSWSSAVR
jgi:hypothetical protein